MVIVSKKLKLSSEKSDQLNYLSSRLDIRRNIVCRMAIGRSLAMKKSIKDFKTEDNSGFEFNRYTLTGDYDDIFKALVLQHERKRIGDNQYFSKYLRNHMERGIGLLYEEYQKVNSPIEFLVTMAEGK